MPWEQFVWPAVGRQNTARQEVSIALVLRISSINADFCHNNMQMKISLWGETAWPGFNSASSAGLMTPITATMKAQIWPWQQCCWGKMGGQKHVQKAGTDPDQQMACNDSSGEKVSQS